MARLGGDIIRRSIHWCLGRLPDAAAPDGQLLERFVTQADESAFTMLVQRHGRLVYNLCLRILRNAADADDAFQATFFVLARKAASIRKQDSVASWLYGVAYRIAVRAKSKASSRKTLESDEVDMAQPDPSSEAAWRELEPLLDSELERLPEKYKAPLLLCYFEGKSNDEAARLLGWPSGTVKGRLARARNLLRQRLEQHGLAVPIATLIACLSGQAMAAPVPSHLVQSTVSATMMVVAGEATAGMLSANAVALSKGELHSMFLSNLKVVTAVLLVTGIGAWVSISGYQAWADKPASGLDLPLAASAADTADKSADPAKSPFEGRWTAKLEVGGESIAVRVEFQTDANKLKGIVRLAKDKMFDLTNIKVAGTKISFDCEADEASLSLTGELKDGTVSGTLEMLGKKQGLQEGTWSMTKR